MTADFVNERIEKNIGINNTAHDFLGKAVWWSIKDGRYSLERFRDLLEINGLDKKLAYKVSPKKAYTEMIEDLCREMKAEAVRVAENGNMIQTRVVWKAVKEDLTLELKQDTMISFVKGRDVIELNVGGDSLVFAKAIDKYNMYLQTVSDSYIRSILEAFCQSLYSVRLRVSGGIYFVPNKNVDKIDAMATVLDGIGAGVLYRIRVPRGSSEGEAICDMGANDIENRISAIVDGVKLRATQRGFRGCLSRVSGVDEILESYQELLKCEEIAEDRVAIFDKLRDRCKEVAEEIMVVATASVNKNGQEMLF